MPASAAGGGVGTSGAGASGGPLVSAKSTFSLDGIPAAARNFVNKQVQVTGRVDRNPTVTGATGDAANSATPGNSTAGNRTPVLPNANGSERKLIVEGVQLVAQTCAAQ